MRLRMIAVAGVLALSSSACKSGLGGSCTQGSDCSSGVCTYEPDQPCSQSDCDGTCECAPETDGGDCDAS